MTTYRTPQNRTYAAIGDPCTMSSGVYICLDVSLPNRPKSVRWFKRDLLTVCEAERPADYVAPCTALTIWRPIIELPIWELGYYREGGKEKAVPGVNLLTSNVRIMLTLGEAA